MIPLQQHGRYELEQRRRNSPCADLFSVLDEVADPEIPHLSIWDLGVLQDITRQAEQISVTITPTYSGCPAVAQIREDIVTCLQQAGFRQVEVEVVLAPAWSTEWLSDRARQTLHDNGIASPGERCCPQCGSTDVAVISEYGATACKALLRCRTCAEPFDYFKPL